LYNGLVETGLSYFINVACYDYKIWVPGSELLHRAVQPDKNHDKVGITSEGYMDRKNVLLPEWLDDLR
jgi:hypothetical protein